MTMKIEILDCFKLLREFLHGRHLNFFLMRPHRADALFALE